MFQTNKFNEYSSLTNLLGWSWKKSKFLLHSTHIPVVFLWTGGELFLEYTYTLDVQPIYIYKSPAISLSEVVCSPPIQLCSIILSISVNSGIDKINTIINENTWNLVFVFGLSMLGMCSAVVITSAALYLRPIDLVCGCAGCCCLHPLPLRPVIFCYYIITLI